jgi:integrase
MVSGQKDPLGVTFHTLRHTFASWLVMAGVDLKTVATLLGHSTTHQVERTYGHLSPDHKRRAVEQLGAWLRTIPTFEDPK